MQDRFVYVAKSEHEELFGLNKAGHNLSLKTFWRIKKFKIAVQREFLLQISEYLISHVQKVLCFKSIFQCSNFALVNVTSQCLSTFGIKIKVRLKHKSLFVHVLSIVQVL